MSIIKRYWKVIFASVLSCIFICIPFYNIILNGTYTPFLKSAPVFQGGLEVIIFIFLTMIAMSIFKRKAHIVLLFSSCLYLSISAVIIPVIAVGVYFEILCYIGSAVISFKKGNHSTDIVLNYISGVSIWGGGAVLVSLLNHGTVNELRVLTLVLFIVSFALSYSKQYTPVIIRFGNFMREGNEDRICRLMLVILSYLILILFAKTNYAIEWDSMHYGLKPELTLVGEHSFYDYLGFSCFVHYYPKFWELLYLPISSLGDYSFLLSANIFNLLIISYLVFRILGKLLMNVSRNEKLFITLLIISIPAVANVSVTTKPDILGLLLFLFAFYKFICWWKTKNIIEFIFSMTALMISTGTKLTYLLWGGILFIFTFILFLLNEHRHKTLLIQLKRIRIIEIAPVFTGIILTLGVHYRTLKLTGYPTYPTGVSFYRKLGFQPKHHALLNSVENNANILEENLKETIIQLIQRFYHVFFNPDVFPTLIILWFSNLFLLLLIFCVLYNVKYELIRDKVNRIFLIVYVIFYSVFIFYMFYITGFVDGNYYIAPIIVNIILSYFFLRKYSTIFSDFSVKKIFTVILASFIVFQFVITFVSSPSWVLGTHPFQNELIRNNFDTEENNRVEFLYRGCNKIAEWIADNSVNGKLLASTELNISYRFYAPLEMYFYIESSRYCNSGIIDYNTFKSYIKETNVSGIVLADADEGNLRDYTLKYTMEYNIHPTVIDEAAVLYIIQK